MQFICRSDSKRNRDVSFSSVRRSLPVGLALGGTEDVSFGSVLRSLAATRSCAETTDLLEAETLIFKYYIYNISYKTLQLRTTGLLQDQSLNRFTPLPYFLPMV